MHISTHISALRRNRLAGCTTNCHRPGLNMRLAGETSRSIPIDVIPPTSSKSFAHPVTHSGCHHSVETEKAKNPRAWTWGFFVELRGIEPLTSSMPWKRSTN
jgi:hypothetical protein